MWIFLNIFKDWIKSDFFFSDKQNLFCVCLGTLDYVLAIFNFINHNYFLCVTLFIVGNLVFYTSWNRYILSDEFFDLTKQRIKDMGLNNDENIQELLNDIEEKNMTKQKTERKKYTMKKHQNDKVDTFETNISLMCKDVLDYIEQQPSEDCVSRQEVKKIAKEMYLEVANMDLDVYTISDCISYTSSKCRQVLEDKLQALPPVTPTHGTCDDCHYSLEKNNFQICTKYHEIVKRHGFYCADYEKRGNENVSS